MKKITSILITLTALFFCTATANAASVGEKLPGFSLTTDSGEKFSSSEYDGKNPVFMVFWATWCPNCKKEIPELKKLYNEYSSKGLKFIAVNVGVNDSEKRMKKFVKKYKIDYPTAFDAGGKLTREFKVQGIPAIIIADKDGIIKYNSYTVPKDFDSHFNELL